MHRYQNNAFRILGLPSTATLSDVMSRANEIKVKNSIGASISYEYDFPWMGPLDRSDENVIHAMQRLEDPILRFTEELFWFWIDNKEDKDAMYYLAQNKRQAAHEIWGGIAEDSRSSINGLINQAILAHSSAIGKEISVKYGKETVEEKILIQEASELPCCPVCGRIYEGGWKVCLKCGVPIIIEKKEQKTRTTKTKKSDSALSDAHWKNWRFVINKFLILNSSEHFWVAVSKRAKKINDPRLSESKINEFKENFIADVAASNLNFISMALASKDYERTKHHSGLLNGANLPANILKRGLNRALTSHIDLVNKRSDNTLYRISNLPSETAKEAIMSIYNKLVCDVKDLIYEGNLVDINCISDFVLSRDKAANVLKSISVEVNNRFNDYKTAHEIIEEATEYAASPYLKQKFEKDEAIIRGNLNFAELSKKTVVAPKGINVASILSKLKRISWGAWVWIAIILIGVISSSTSNKTTKSPTPSYKYRATATSESLPQLKTRIENLKEQALSKGKRLEAAADILKTRETELADLKQQIASIEARYKDVDYVPDNVRKDYDGKIDEHNRLLAIYKDLHQQAQNLYNEYQADVKNHDSLVEKYNSQIRR